MDNGWLAEELASKQTLDNLHNFSERLALADKFRRTKTEKSKKAFFAAQIKVKKLSWPVVEIDDDNA